MRVRVILIYYFILYREPNKNGRNIYSRLGILYFGNKLPQHPTTAQPPLVTFFDIGCSFLFRGYQFVYEGGILYALYIPRQVLRETIYFIPLRHPRVMCVAWATHAAFDSFEIKYNVYPRITVISLQIPSDLHCSFNKCFLKILLLLRCLSKIQCLKYIFINSILIVNTN